MQTLEPTGAGSVPPVHPQRKPAPWPIQFWRSAVGKKWIMAVTGIMLMGYVFAHMVGNLKIYQSAESINHYGEFLRELLYPIFPRTVFLWILRIGLTGAFVAHIAAAISLTRMNQRSNAGQYNQARDWQAANAASRSMRITGTIILAYLIFHLADLTWGASFNGEYTRGDVYGNVLDSMGYAPVAIVYIIANIALGVHLYHGAWSMFQSLGVNNPKYNEWRRKFALGFAVIVAAGNLTFPISVMTGVVDGDDEADCVEVDGDWQCLVEDHGTEEAGE